MKTVFFFITFSIAMSSCNYRLFVYKDNIYHKRTGYLVFFNRNMIFYPSKHITGNDFFNAKISKGYLVNFERDEAALYNASEKYTIDYEYLQDDRKIFVRDTVRVIPVETRSVPMNLGLTNGETDFIIRYNNTLHNFPYRVRNNESILNVYPILEKDIREASEFYSKGLNN
ncbi:hypothetical protein AAHN97_12045 [Chitinophaga niabensis]|uniref:hypothetical protein n=1 Tax=Chitinophaga niabensis TaxID=536979 RepID=UPI0031BB02F3